MNALPPSPPQAAPRWTTQVIRSRRGSVDDPGMFAFVHFIALLDGTNGSARSRQLLTPGGEALFSQVVSTGHEIALEEPRSLTLILPLAGRLSCATGHRDIAAGPGEALVLPPGRRRTRTERPGTGPFRALVLMMPPDGQAAAADAPVVFRLKTAKSDLATAARILSTLCAPDADPAEALRLVTEVQALVSEGLREARQADAPVSRLPGSAHPLRRAETLLHDRFAEDITIAGIAAEAGISLRQLQDLFRKAHGLSPHAYLTRLRLEQAHFSLMTRSPAPSVTEAALLAGFGHLGRFPRTYRIRFGRLPSESRLSPG